MSIIARLLKAFRSAERDDRVVIDQTAYFDRLSDERRRQRRIAEENDRYEFGMAKLARNWASTTLELRRRERLPTKLPAAVQAWLPGLTVQELIVLSKASHDAIQAHLFGGKNLAGVRAVQPLDECVLVFPKPVAEPMDPRIRRFS
ncbi:hypothetical protein SSBR45G_46690 [Bradyrhizobium sp. SSBR45G]|uniref:hypothetical protein n=1 Tax=unclassified Bradyrhizobium TaxID=2631580 RepID=UPI0023429888|nr:MULTISPECIES: hypothetical protein [unclassified Bradyrhizobium]GLH79760.1 hypothetical protein SSBR45G_46690 [Bradyrhizobium sp. SSBR45G]GLH87122.1 hypothetical protein SSBR45R_45820 [Bradyrhizobium sp. SSBR45R]